MERELSKEDYYLNIAREVSRRGTCLRRNYGAVIVKDDRIISTGYTGAVRYGAIEVSTSDAVYPKITYTIYVEQTA